MMCQISAVGKHEKYSSVQKLVMVVTPFETDDAGNITGIKTAPSPKSLPQPALGANDLMRYVSQT